MLSLLEALDFVRAQRLKPPAPLPDPGSTIHTRSRTSPDISAVGTHGPLGSNGDGRRESRPPSLSNAHFRKKCRLRWVGGGQNSEAGDRRTTVARQQRDRDRLPSNSAGKAGYLHDPSTLLGWTGSSQAGHPPPQGYGGRGCAVPRWHEARHACRGCAGASLLAGRLRRPGERGTFFRPVIGI